MTRVTPPQSARQQRHLAFVSEFTTDLRHTPGSENVVADALSRPPAVSLSSCTPATAGLPVLSIPPPSDPPLTAVAADAQPVDFTELAFAQPSCPDVQAMLASSSLSVVSKKVGAAEILGDVSTGTFRPLLPARFRSAAVLSLHNIHHPGVRASRRLVCASFCWPKMGSFVSALVRNCIQCQKAKVHRHVSLQAAHIPVPGSIPDCDALIPSRSGPSLLSSGCSPTLYAEDVGGPGQAPTPPSMFGQISSP